MDEGDLINNYLYARNYVHLKHIQGMVTYLLNYFYLS